MGCGDWAKSLGVQAIGVMVNGITGFLKGWNIGLVHMAREAQFRRDLARLESFSHSVTSSKQWVKDGFRGGFSKILYADNQGYKDGHGGTDHQEYEGD